MGRRLRNAASDVFFIQRDRASLTRKVPYFLLGITALLSMNILLLLQQQPNENGLPVVQSEFLDSRRLRQYIEPSDEKHIEVIEQKHEYVEVKDSVEDHPRNIKKKVVDTITKTTTTTTTKKPVFQEIKVTAAASQRPVVTMRKPVKMQAAASDTTRLPDPVVYGASPKNLLPPLQPGSYITPNEILQRTAVAIKTFNRAECLMQTVISFQTNYPDMPIFVADDSFEDTVSANLTQNFGVTYIRLAIDSGVGYGRNRLVEHLYNLGYQYMIMSDDDYTIDQHDLLLMMAEHLINTRAHAIAPLRCDYGHCERSKGMIHMSKNGELTVFPNMTSYPAEPVHTCHRSDLMQQFFLTETATLKSVGWDDKLKNNDHYDFLFNSKRNSLRLVTCTDLKVMHNKKICQDKVQPELMDSYLKTRAERWLKLTSHVFKKWNLTTLYDETGKTIKINSTGSPIINPVERVVVDIAHPFRKYFEDAVLDHHNNMNPGWYSLRLKPNSRKTYIVYKQLNRCMYWLGGKLDTEYDRHASFPNKDQVISFEFHHVNRSCPISEDFWHLTNFGKLDKKHVYLITAVSNDATHMERLLSLVNNQTNRLHTTFVIVDMGKENEKFDLSQYSKLVNTEYLYLGGPFSRSIGLKKGFDFAKQLAEQRGHTDAIGFSIDTSIIIPANFTDAIRSHTRCGVSSYAPVCYKHKDPGGYWVTTGYGMIGACFADYDAVGGWDTRWGYRWGAEDVDIMNRMKGKIPYTVRTKEDNFEHIHSGSTRNTYKGYYKNKNLYDGELPVTPLTTALNDTGLAERLMNWVKPRMRYPIPLNLYKVYQTHNPQTDRTMYDVRLKNANNEDYYAVVDSLL